MYGTQVCRPETYQSYVSIHKNMDLATIVNQENSEIKKTNDSTAEHETEKRMEARKPGEKNTRVRFKGMTMN